MATTLEAPSVEDTWSGICGGTNESAGICFSGESERSNVPLHHEKEEFDETTCLSSPAGVVLAEAWGKDSSSGFNRISHDHLSEGSICRIQRTRSRIYKRAVIWVLIGGITCLWLVVFLLQLHPKFMYHVVGPSINFDYSRHYRTIRGEPVPTGVLSYLELFPKKAFKSTAHRQLLGSSASTTTTISSGGTLNPSGGSPSPGGYKGAQLVIAGKMTVEDAPCNIAQFNFKTQEWSLTERIQLSLYNSYSGGEVYSLLANHTNQPDSESSPVSSNSNRSVRKLCSSRKNHMRLVD